MRVVAQMSTFQRAPQVYLAPGLSIRMTVLRNVVIMGEVYTITPLLIKLEN